MVAWIGEELAELSTSGKRFTESWLKALEDRDLDRAYLETLPVGERRRQARARKRCESAAGAAPALPAADPDCRAYLEGRAAFRAKGWKSRG